MLSQNLVVWLCGRQGERGFRSEIVIIHTRILMSFYLVLKKFRIGCAVDFGSSVSAQPVIELIYFAPSDVQGLNERLDLKRIVDYVAAGQKL